MGFFAKFGAIAKSTKLHYAMKESFDRIRNTHPEFDYYNVLLSVWFDTIDKIGPVHFADTGILFVRLSATMTNHEHAIEFLSHVISLYCFDGFKETPQVRELQQALMEFENVIRKDGGRNLTNLLADLNPNALIFTDKIRFDLNAADAIEGVRRWSYKIE